MSFSFDGSSKIISLSLGTTSIVTKELYSSWKEWTLTDNNSKFLEAISVLGGDPLPGGRYLGTTYFLENDWKIRPSEENHTLIVSGNLYSRDGSDPFISTVGNFNVRIMLTVSNLIDTITTSGSSSGGSGNTTLELRDAIWNASQSSYSSPGTFGQLVSSIKTDTTTIKNYTDTLENSLIDIQDKIDELPSNIRLELEPELKHIMVLQNGMGLDSPQALMLKEIYNLYGLDMTKPLVVTKTSRVAGDINQTIDSNESRTIISRT